MFHMSNDSGLFRTRAELEEDEWQLEGSKFVRGMEVMLPLYQGLMVDHYDHRAADVIRSATAVQRQNQPCYLTPADKDDPSRLAVPAYWVKAAEVTDRLQRHWERDWLLGFCRITSPTNSRTIITSFIPSYGNNDQFSLLLSSRSPIEISCLGASLNSFAFDFVARQKVGGTTMNFFLVEQLPVLQPGPYQLPAPWDRTTTTGEWNAVRVLELTYTAWDLASFASDLGDDGSPFRWEEERRTVLRSELDAAFFHLYGLNRADTDYVLSTFHLVEKHDEERFGEYRTKRLILENYDAMAKAIETGEPFVSTLSPPPGKGPRHPAKATVAARVETGRETVRVGAAARGTGCGHSPQLGGGTPGCQVCAFNSKKS
jgi:hypothetical protein